VTDPLSQKTFMRDGLIVNVLEANEITSSFNLYIPNVWSADADAERALKGAQINFLLVIPTEIINSLVVPLSLVFNFFLSGDKINECAANFIKYSSRKF